MTWHSQQLVVTNQCWQTAQPPANSSEFQEPVEPWLPSKMDLALKLFSRQNSQMEEQRGVISVEQHKALVNNAGCNQLFPRQWNKPGCYSPHHI